MPRILLIEDDPAVANVLQHHLLQLGFTVGWSREGSEAMRDLAANATDMVLCDLIMPGMEGVETIRSIRATHPRVLIVAMSGGGRIRSEDLLASVRYLGADATLTKPFSEEALADVLRSVLGTLPAPRSEPPPRLELG